MKTRTIVLNIIVGTLAPLACLASDVTITATGGTAWEPSSPTVAVGDVILWKIGAGRHGVIFDNFPEAEKVLRIEPDSLPIAEQPGFNPPAKGTAAALGAGKLLVKATVIAIPEGATEVPFTCTQHSHMKGKLKLQTSPPTAVRAKKEAKRK